MLNKNVKMKFLIVSYTRFTLVIIMLQVSKTIKRGLQNLVLSDRWAMYRDNGLGKAQFC